MQIDISPELISPPPYSGWLEKRGNVRKVWKARYFCLSNGLLKYYEKGPKVEKPNVFTEGSDMKGDFNLVGAEVSIADKTEIHISMSNDKKSSFQIRANTEDNAVAWLENLKREIKYQNINALVNGTRLPIVIEWYYQYQSGLQKDCQFLSKPAEVKITFPSMTRSQPDKPSLFNIAMTDDKSGLLLSLPAGTKKSNRQESINNGRIILFADIIGVYLEDDSVSNPTASIAYNYYHYQEEWKINSSNEFRFTLLTKEDEFHMSIEGIFGITWLYNVYNMVLFQKIPKPSSRSISISPNPRHTRLLDQSQTEQDNNNPHHNISIASSIQSIQSIIEFNSNSGVVYLCPNDIQLLLQNLYNIQYKSPLISDIIGNFQTIFKSIVEIKSNRDIFVEFMVRIEEIVHILADYDTGLLYLANEHDHKNILAANLLTLNNKLLDIISLYTTLSSSNWLQYYLNNNSNSTSFYTQYYYKYGNSSTASSAASPMHLGGATTNVTMNALTYKIIQLDTDLMTIMNMFIKNLCYGPSSLANSSSLLGSNLPIEPENLNLTKKEYTIAVDVKKSIEALGGVEVIFHDIAKEQALSRIIQCDATNLHNELLLYIQFLHAHPSLAAQMGGNSSSNKNTERDSRSSRPSITSPAFYAYNQNNQSVNESNTDYYLFSDHQNSSANYSNSCNTCSGFWSYAIYKYLCCCACLCPKRNRTSSNTSELNRNGSNNSSKSSSIKSSNSRNSNIQLQESF